MPASINQEIKSEVIKQWLAGMTRDRIAMQNRIGTGTVSTIIKDWREGLVDFDIESVRQLAVDIRKQGMNLTECADATRLINRIKKLGGKINGIDKLITGIQTKCLSHGLPSEKICELLIQLFDISKSESISLELVPDHITQKIQDLKQEYEAKRSKLHCISLLLGLNDWDILQWSEILEKYRDVIDVESLADDIEHYGSIREAVVKESQKVRELRTEKSRTEAEIESLKKEKERIEKSIIVVEQTTIKTIERIGEASIQAVSNKVNELEETQGITRMSESNYICDNQNAQLADHQSVKEKPPIVTYQRDLIADSN
jgi:chromosome segregation ATPase